MKTLGYKETQPNNHSAKKANKNRDRKRTLSCDNANDDDSDKMANKNYNFKSETKKLFERDMRRSQRSKESVPQRKTLPLND